MHVCLLKSHVCGISGGILDADSVQVSHMRELLRHIETSAPPLAAAQLPQSMWTEIGESHLLHRHYCFFAILSYFTGVMMDSLKSTSWGNCVRI